MKTKTFVGMSIAIALLAFPAAGEPENPPAKDAPQAESQERPRHDFPGGMPDEELRDMVSTIMMVRVSRSLELSDEQTVIMVKHMQEMRDALSKLYGERDDIMKALRDITAKEGATDDEINAKLQALMTSEDKRVQAKRDAFDSISSGLTAKQKAKLYITLQDFEGQIRKMMQRAKEMGEDAVREKFQEWDRGDGPPRGSMDRPMVKQFLKNRRPGPPTPVGEVSAPAPAEPKAE